MKSPSLRENFEEHQNIFEDNQSPRKIILGLAKQVATNLDALREAALEDI